MKATYFLLYGIRENYFNWSIGRKLNKSVYLWNQYYYFDFPQNRVDRAGKTKKSLSPNAEIGGGDSSSLDREGGVEQEKNAQKRVYYDVIE